MQAQADWLDGYLTELERSSNKPTWIIVYAHLSPMTVSRTKRLQRWIPVFEKHSIPLVLCGHNHAYSRSIPVKCGYVSGAYNDFTTKATTTTDSNYEIIDGLKILKNEVQGDGSTEIDRSAHPADGVYYVLNEACGLV